LKKSALGVLFLTVVVDLLGFGIVLPLLPRYAEMYDVSGAQIGLLFASFSAMQFLCAPFWGRLSDRIGRRGPLMIGLFGSVASYTLFAFADSYELLLVSRITAGFFGATIGTAQAYIADVTGREDRGKQMALIGAAFGVGFTVGPAVGGLSYGWFGPAAPGLVAAGLSAIALLLAWRVLPEPESHLAPKERKLFDGAALRHAAQTPGLLLVIGLQFLATFCFANFEGTLARLSEDRWHMDIKENGFIFTYVGFCLLLAQGFIVRRFLPRFGEVKFVYVGALLLGLGLAGVAAGFDPILILPVPVLGFSMLSPSLSSLLSLKTPAHMQGEVLGLGQSALALARIAGPYLGNVLYDITPETPFWVAGGVAVFALLMASGLRPQSADN
jgi:multidrug resistance protein